MNKCKRKPGCSLLNNINHSLISQWLQQLENDIYELIITNNKLEDIPNEIYNLLYLEKLVINYNYIRIFNLSKKLNFLHILDLSNNSITNLSFFIGTMTSLRELYLSFNKLEKFPEEMLELKDLLIFDCSHNRLSEFPSFLCFEKSQIKEITLNNNFIQTIPDHVVNMEQLRVLNLCHNNISILNPLIRTLKCLDTFEIFNNPLISPPLSICVKGRLHIFRYLAILSRQKIIKSAIKTELSETIISTSSQMILEPKSIENIRISSNNNILHKDTNSLIAKTSSLYFDNRNQSMGTSLEYFDVSNLTRKPDNHTKKYSSNNRVDIENLKPIIALETACSDQDFTQARIKVKAYEDLKSVETACFLINHAIKSKVDVENFSSQLSDGVYLCKYFNFLCLGNIEVIHLPSAGVSKLTVRKCHLNVHNFVDSLKKTNQLDGRLICTVADILMERNSVGIANTIILMDSKKLKNRVN